MTKLNLVLGANGHLGNNLVRMLLENGERVRASMRNPGNKSVLSGLDCEIVQADILDKESLLRVMEGADVVYDAAAVYKSWARDIANEIIRVNIEGTRNVIEAAAARRVKKMIYISTCHALDLNQDPLDETSWNRDFDDPYRESKTRAEKLAWELAKKHTLWMVSLLPSGMIGPNFHDHLTPTMEALASILNNKLPFDPGFNMNLVDIRDVAQTTLIAAEKGRNGERYLLAQEQPVNTTEIFELAHEINPKVKIPRKIPVNLLSEMAGMMEFIGNCTKRQPLMLRSQVRTFTSAMKCNIGKAQQDLAFHPRPQLVVLNNTFQLLQNRSELVQVFERNGK